MDQDKSPSEVARPIVEDGATNPTHPFPQVLNDRPKPALKLPPVTLAILVICAAVWAGLNFGQETAKQAIGELLAPSALKIWGGAYWTLITSAFVHLDPLHGLFNMWWTKDFGRLLEPRFGSRKFVGFILCSAVVSSGWQLAFSDQTGIGFSGVVYAFFGYMLAARDRDPVYRSFLNRNTIIWLVGWLFLCIGLTRMGMWSVANAAHVSGLVFGFIVGSMGKSHRLVIPARIAAALIGVGALVPVAYMPWSEVWKYRDVLRKYDQAEELAKRGDPEGQFYHGVALLERGKNEGTGNEFELRVRGDAKTGLTAMEKEGLDLLKKSAEQGYVPAMNDFAWRLATDPRESVRNGSEALKWAEKVCEGDDWATPAYIDTLAAAHAELGQWDRAIEFQIMAIEKIGTANEEINAELQARLELYQRKAGHDER